MAYCPFCKQDVELSCSGSPDVLTLAGLCACEHYFKKSQSLMPYVDPSETDLDFSYLEGRLACMFCRKCFSNDEIKAHCCDGREKAQTALEIDENSSPLVVSDDESLEYPGYE